MLKRRFTFPLTLAVSLMVIARVARAGRQQSSCICKALIRHWQKAGVPAGSAVDAAQPNG